MIVIEVRGDPAPKGSKSFKGMSKAGHAILVESSKKVKPWTEAVKWAAMEKMSYICSPLQHDPISGPVSVNIIFTVRKPKSAPKRTQTWPIKKPDMDKLTRCIYDALKQAGVYNDDAQVIESSQAKRFPNEGTGALDSPGCLIQVEAL